VVEKVIPVLYVIGVGVKVACDIDIDFVKQYEGAAGEAGLIVKAEDKETVIALA
jgi:hypothetical protein